MTNTGYRNTGDRNTGDRNTGNRNTGDRNTGYRNTGYRNTGYRNTGDRNTGYRNTGNRNAGNRNTGYRNTGYRNTGDRNTGNRNTGNRNTGYRNTGYLNTKSPTEGLLFNKLTTLWDSDGNRVVNFPKWFYFDLISSNGTDNPCLRIPLDQMSDAEKKANPNAETVDGYIKVGLVDKDMKVHWRRAFDKCEDLEDIKKTLELPNFEYKIFEEISGISEEDFNRKLWTTKTEDIIIKNGKKYRVQILGEVE